MQQRHQNMAAIRSKDTKPEMIVRKGLWSRGFRYRLNHIFLQDHGISPRPQITRITQIGQMEEESENYLKAAEEEI